MIAVDLRSLACLRVGTAAVLAWDMLRALSVADDWWAMQAYGEAKLPTWLTIGSQTITLQLAATAVLGLSVLLALGWRTRTVTFAAWASACAFQYAARNTGDYHNAVLCTLLFWSLILPTGARMSLDARARRPVVTGTPLLAVGAAGLLLSVAWIYLTTAAAKSGSAWWAEGSAVWLALLDRGTPTEPGRWLALAMPAWVWPPVTWAVLAMEWSAPALLLWRRTRTAAVICLVLLHLTMWPLLALGAFPLVMIAAVVALMPGSFWDQLGWSGGQESPPGGRWCRRDRLVALGMALALLVTMEGERVVKWEGDRAWPYPGARHIARARYLLGMEVVWGMYAPEPFRHTGWWIAVAWRGDGTVVDPITGAPPTLQPPNPGAPDAQLRWLAMSDAPWRDGVQHAYRNFLLERRNGSASDRTDDGQLRRLALIWANERLSPYQAPAAPTPVLVLSWPDSTITAAEIEPVIGVTPVHAEYDDNTGDLLAPVPLSPFAQWLP